MKRCSQCKKEKELSEFYSDKISKDGKGKECKQCRSKRSKTTYSKTNNKRWWLRRKFNITLEQYDQMFEEQNGVCAICGKPESDTYKGIIRRLAVDHDHKTGKIRSLLCARCNNALGCVNDDINILIEMIKYLKIHLYPNGR